MARSKGWWHLFYRFTEPHRVGGTNVRDFTCKHVQVHAHVSQKQIHTGIVHCALGRMAHGSRTEKRMIPLDPLGREEENRAVFPGARWYLLVKLSRSLSSGRIGSLWSLTLIYLRSIHYIYIYILGGGRMDGSVAHVLQSFSTLTSHNTTAHRPFDLNLCSARALPAPPTADT